MGIIIWYSDEEITKTAIINSFKKSWISVSLYGSEDEKTNYALDNKEEIINDDSYTHENNDTSEITSWIHFK